MTLVPPAPIGREPADHVGDLRLRRHKIGELGGAEAQVVTDHLAGCADCRTRLEALDDEQRAFAAQIPFDRFAGGVERAARVPRARPVARRALLAGGGVALAAAAALVLVVRAGGDGAALPIDARLNRVKGGELSTRIQLASTDGTQQALDPGSVTALKPGDRLRLGYRSGQARHLVAVSIDDAGAVTVLEPEQGDTLALTPAVGVRYLPSAIDLTGTGRERIYVVVGDLPFTAKEVVRAVKAEHARAGKDLTAVGPLYFSPGVQVTTFTWLFDKPGP